MTSIYQEIVLDHFQHPRHYGRLPDSRPLTVTNPLCGDAVTFFVKLAGRRIERIKFTAKGCAISIAGASLLSDYALHKTKNELRKLDKNFMIKLLGVELGVNRVKCAMLPLEGLQKLLSRY
ncbi:iron-sulfur cluster assembly scaffold protein [Patescibacteria group bacterium]|nr:iron-sulfur cluster assembly scaffold protein [Patescibacteria group bacterium]MCL5091207.1 iron-sulfur cluster assembly scaffold protein [Patescibacteria group bacterium]